MLSNGMDFILLLYLTIIREEIYMLKRLLRAFPICLIALLLSSCAASTQKSASDKIVSGQNTENDTASQSKTSVSSDHITIESTESKDSEKAVEQKKQVELSTENVYEYEDFCEIDTHACGGILFDEEGNMLVARPKGLDKVSSDGTVTSFCDLNTLEKGLDYYFSSPFIWDMKFDSNKNIIAACQDRILKIDAAGNVTTLIRDDFKGFLGASGLELDKEGNMYVVSGNKVYKYSANLERTEYLISDKYYSFFSISFTPDGKYLYLTDFNTKSIVKYEINEDGSVGEGVEIIREPIKNSGSFAAPLNIIYSDNGDTYISIDGMAHILKIDKDENMSLIAMSEPVSNHIIAFGSKKFGEDYLYFTTYSNKVCKLKLSDSAG